MKEFFYNSSGYNTAEIKIQTLGRELVLHYHLNDNPVQHMWQTMYNQPASYVMGYSNKLTFKEIIDEIKTILIKVGNYSITDNPTQEELNYLHSEFVKYDTSPDWQNVNLLIHQIENYKHSTGLESFNGSLRYYLEKESEQFHLKPEHKLWLTSEKHWGDLLAGYATKGKGWWEICKDEDDIDDLNIQTHLGSETLLIFEPENPTRFSVNNRFYKWSQSTKLSVPTSIEKLSLGRYFLGNIIITDTFTDFNKNISDWYVPNHKCKLQWAKDMIGKDAKVVGINIYNSDLYYDAITRHTGILECIKL